MKNSQLIKLLFLLLTITLTAQNNNKNDKDNLLLPRFPGSEIIYYNQTENSDYLFVLGPLVRSSPDEEYTLTDSRIVTGTLTRIQYKTDETEISRVFNYYEHTLKESGFEIMAIASADKPMDVSGRNWTLFVYKDLDQKLKSNITGTKTGKDNRYYIAGHLHRLNNKTYFTMVINEFNKGEIFIQLDIVTSENNPPQREILSSELIEQNIINDGYAQIDGIYFEPNSAELRKESEPALKEVAEYLKKNMGSILYVVGHTGLQGSLDYLIVLSKNMAASVIKELSTKYNINSERLIAEGVGPLSPLTTNQNIEGRDINKRIVLVLKNY